MLEVRRRKEKPLGGSLRFCVETKGATFTQTSSKGSASLVSLSFTTGMSSLFSLDKSAVELRTCWGI